MAKINVVDRNNYILEATIFDGNQLCDSICYVTKEVLKTFSDRCNKKDTVFGCLSKDVEIIDYSHKIINCTTIGNYTSIIINVLNTPKGEILKWLIDNNVPLKTNMFLLIDNTNNEIKEITQVNIDKQ